MKLCEKALDDGTTCGRPADHEEACGPRRVWSRSNFVPAPHFFQLNHACRLVNDAFDGFGCYLVGSAIERRDHRDVDVRFIMKNEAFDAMFGKGRGGWLSPRWTLLCASISLWLSQQTGLPVDFQIQRQSEANEGHGAGLRRQPLGLFWGPEPEIKDEAKEQKQ